MLFTEDARELSEFTREALNCAALDTCCSSSVAGKVWLDFYLESLDEDRRGEVRGPYPSNKVFKFGNNGRLPSMGSYKIPVTLAKKEVTLELDVVESVIFCFYVKIMLILIQINTVVFLADTRVVTSRSLVPPIRNLKLTALLNQ